MNTLRIISLKPSKTVFLYCPRYFANSPSNAPGNSSQKRHIKVLIVGAGTGGIGVANRLASRVGAENIIVADSSKVHYYQPYFTLVGGGIKNLSNASKTVEQVIPNGVLHVQQNVSKFEPNENLVVMDDASQITYDYLVLTLGIQLRYDLIPGLIKALDEDPRVCSNYSPKYVEKTFKAIQAFTGGNALFTYPNTPVKCAGAPQKIMYLFDDYLRSNKTRDTAKIDYFTSLAAIFGIKHYAKSLNEVCASRDLTINTRHNLIEINSDKSEATFQNLDSLEKVTRKYDLIHVTPPMSSYEVIKSSALADPANGFVAVNKDNLRHLKFNNVFAVGDCASLPTAKTAAGIAGQASVASENLWSVIQGKAPTKQYDGYASCPLVTSRGKCILAEFDYSSEPLETFPFDQSKESQLAYIMKAHFMPKLYWYGLLKGYWNGTSLLRKISHFGFSR